MRILALTNLYPNPYQPHRATFNRHRFRILGEHCPVQVIAPIAWTDEFLARRRGAAPLPKGRREVFDGLIVDHPRYLFPPRFARNWYGQFFLSSVQATFRRVLKEFQPNLVFTPWAYPDGWAAVHLAKRASLPVILQVLGSDVLLLDRFPARRRRTEQALRAADGVVAVSQDLANHVIRMGVDSSKVRVIYDGVDTSTFRPGDKARERAILNLSGEERILLFVGNLVGVKAVDVLLRACAEPALKKDVLRLFVVGQGPLKANLERQAAELGLANRVRFVGSIPHADLPCWFRAADVFVLSSHSEGIPNVLLEASACGTPWVASRVGGIPEIAHLGNSRLVTPNAPPELARAIHDTLSAPAQGLPAAPRSLEDAVCELAAWLQTVLKR